MGGGHRHLLDFPRRDYEGVTLHEQVSILSTSPCCRRTHRPAEPSSPWPPMPVQIVERIIDREMRGGFMIKCDH